MATPTPTPSPAPTGQRQHDFKGLADWIEVFRAGTHTDSKGRKLTFTEADLDQMVTNVALGAAPAVLGHPQHNDPAYAWANDVKRDGTSLYAKFSDINPDFEAGVASGAYRNRSVSVIKDADHGWRLQHVGWLGAARPAIAGLKPVEFSAGAETHEFSADDMTTAWAIDDIATVLRSVREYLISAASLEVADRVVPGWRIDSITQAANRIREQALAEDAAEGAPVNGLQPMFTAPTATTVSPTGATMALTPEDLARTAAETEARLRAELTAQFAAQTATTAAELQRLQAERQAERIGAQIHDWKARGLVLPAEEAGLREFMGAIETGDGEFTFSAATGPVKQTRAQWFAQFMAGRKPVVRLGQQLAGDDTAGTHVDPNNARAIADAASEFQAAEAKAGREISIELAVTKVMAKRGGA